MYIKLFNCCLSLLFPVFLQAQNVGIGTAAPLSKLQVQGSFSVTAPFKQASAQAPIPNKIIVNGGTTYSVATDSIFRLYDPGGPNGNYLANTNGSCWLYVGGSHVSILIEQVALGTGDSLLIYDGNSAARPPLYSVGNNFSGTDIMVNSSVSNMLIIFKSNSDASTGAGFSMLLKRNYLDLTQPDPESLSGNSLAFYPVKSAFRIGPVLQSEIGRNSVAMGAYNAATGSYSVAMGLENTASGYNSLALGGLSAATGANAVAMGYRTQATGPYSLAMGYQTSTPGTNSFATGLETISRALLSVVIGRFNDTIAAESPTTWQATDRAFVIGDGTNNNTRSSCFYILKNGNGWMQGTLTQASDARLKKNMVPLKATLPKLMRLAGYNYLWKDSSNMPGLQAGLLAQEVQQQMPELVTTNTEGQLAVNYSGMIPYLLQGIKEQQAIIDAQQKQIDQLLIAVQENKKAGRKKRKHPSSISRR